jgi:CBS domain containing-hemolysin-like protein
MVSGMITLENVLEELVGPIQDEFDNEIPGILRKPGRQFEVDALCPVDAIVKELQLELPETTSDTIGGVLVEHFGRIPAQGEKAVMGDQEITVLEAGPTRIHRVLVKKLKSESEQAPNNDPQLNSESGHEAN